MNTEELLNRVEVLEKENQQLKKKTRDYNYTFAELIDKLVINQLKEVKIHEHKSQYVDEIKEILHDIDSIIESENIRISANDIRNIIILAIFNEFIWQKEANARKGIKEDNSLLISHSFNGVRNRAKNKIQEILGGRKDHKLDCLAEEFTAWEPTWNI